MYDLKYIPRAAVFVLVVQEGSFSRAARKLRLSRSVVSTQIRELEDALGVRLLERTTRSLHLTGAGRQFHSHASKMLSAWLEGCELARSHADTPHGRLRITSSGVMAGLLTPVVAEYLIRYPGIEVELLYSDKLVHILNEQIDIALRAGPLQDSSLVARLLGRDDEAIFAHPKLARDWTDASQPEHLRLAPWIVHTALPTPGKWTFTGPDERTVALAVRPTVSVSTATGLVALVANGVGYAVMPTSMAKGAVEEGTLVRVLPKWCAGISTLYAVYTSRDKTPAKTIHFLEVLTEAAKTWMQR